VVVVSQWVAVALTVAVVSQWHDGGCEWVKRGTYEYSNWGGGGL
jgi:hypothetical protein